MQNQRLSLKLKYRFSSSSSYFSMLFWERGHEKHNNIWINIYTGYIDTPKFLKVKSSAPDMSRETSDQTPKEELRWQSRQPTKLLCLTQTDDSKKHIDVIYEKKLRKCMHQIRKNARICWWQTRMQPQTDSSKTERNLKREVGTCISRRLYQNWIVNSK